MHHAENIAPCALPSQSLIIRNVLIVIGVLTTSFLFPLSNKTATLTTESKEPLFVQKNIETTLSHSELHKSLLKSNAIAKPSFPRSIYQTTESTKLPSKLAANFEKYAKGWGRTIFNDSMAIALLDEYYQPEVSVAFRALRQGAHKADLFRYAVMYVLGGVYLDIKTELLTPLDWLFEDRTSIFLVISHISPGTIYNGILAAPSHQPIFLYMVQYMLERGDPGKNYFYNIAALFDYVAANCESLWTWAPDRCFKRQTCAFAGMKFRFAQEEQRAAVQCPDGRDRHGHCAYITESCEKIFKERYSDYPW